MTELIFIQDSLKGKKFKPNLNFEFTIAIPDCEQAEYALLVEHDRLNDSNVNALLRHMVSSRLFRKSLHEFTVFFGYGTRK